MSFFAVLDVENTSDRDKLAIKTLHLNIWALAALSPGRRSFVVDVGVELEATEESSKFSLALPFPAYRCEDLAPVLQNPTNATLVFDESTDFNSSKQALIMHKSDGTASELRLLRTATGTVRDTARSSAEVSIWNVVLADPLPANVRGYLRVRFEVAGPSPAWHWRGSSLARRAWLLDLRVADIRSTLTFTARPEIERRILAIDRVYAFAMLPEHFVPDTLSPDARYVRALEPRVWGNYLKRRPELSARRLVVFYWRGERITTSNPFRVYAGFSVPSRPRVLGALLLAILIGLVVAGVVFQISLQPWVQATLAGLGGWIAARYQAAVAVGLLAVVAAAVRRAKHVVSALRWMQRISHQFEAWIFQVTRRRD